jgi:hypothetical protein
MADESEIVINNPPTDEKPRGRPMYTVKVEAEPIAFNLSPKLLGLGPAKAIAKLIGNRIASITARASPRTLAIRAAAQRAYQRGSAEAASRYGNSAPNQSDKLLNDSGRLAQTIRVELDNAEGAYGVAVSKDRLEPSTLHDSANALARIGDVLKEHVPELADPELLMSEPSVVAAVERAIRASRRKIEGRQNRSAVAVAAALAGLDQQT